MKLNHAKAGQKYRLYLDKDGKLVGDHTTTQTIVGTIIAIYSDGSKILFGWKPNESAPDNAKSRDGIAISTSYKYIPTQKEYNRSATMSVEAVVHSRVPEHGEMDGCVCSKCHNFYPYAEPNQEDGTLICYSCRTTW
jgi:hypothetical protein